MRRRLTVAERFELAAHLAVELYPMNVEKCKRFFEKCFREGGMAG